MPPPQIVAGGDHHPPPTSACSPEHPFLSARLLLPSLSSSPADLSSPHLPLSLAFSFRTHPSPLPRHLDECREKLVSFCASMLRDHFQVCALIGRDLVRSLHELVLVAEFQALWRDLMLHRGTDVCWISTPGCFTAVAITPEMETQLLFMMNNVKWGDQKRHQLWFSRKHLMVPGGEGRIPDIVRFICCGCHPTNEIMQSGAIARWTVIGWLLTSCSKGYVRSWLCSMTSSVMNIEPAMLLMVNSVSQYTDITNMLLEFLFLLIENYDVRRKEALAQCVRRAFVVLVNKGVVPSLEPLACCEKLSPLLRQKLVAFLSNTGPGAAEEACGKSIDEAAIVNTSTKNVSWKSTLAFCIMMKLICESQCMLRACQHLALKGQIKNK
ncbi:uncharacterized protein LOC133900028 [Phragmites australis]|uniref:uncharacterized protein LOC133900028 n=1 Tax=Phragmites australis TaxID=29695 RepID=UPI002D776AF8|nr:uncharacterized protein LOC133900028 [Phragmites australis]